MAYLTDQVQFKEHLSNKNSKEDFRLSIIKVNQAARLYVIETSLIHSNDKVHIIKNKKENLIP